jgi:hypothetical protein
MITNPSIEIGALAWTVAGPRTQLSQGVCFGVLATEVTELFNRLRDFESPTWWVRVSPETYRALRHRGKHVKAKQIEAYWRAHRH